MSKYAYYTASLLLLHQMTLASNTFNTFTCLRLSLYKRNQPWIPFREYNDIINWSCKFHETPVMFMHRGVQQISSDFSIYTDRLNYAKQFRTVSRLLFAEHTIQWKLINFRKRYSDHFCEFIQSQLFPSDWHYLLFHLGIFTGI